MLRLPAIGGLFHLIAVERFCRVLSALVTAGVPLPDAVQVSADSTNNRVFQTKLATVREAMIRGEGLARPITESALFPPAARQMIRVGERAGSLDVQLATAATYYERELGYRLKKATDAFRTDRDCRRRVGRRLRRGGSDLGHVQHLSPDQGAMNYSPSPNRKVPSTDE